MSSTLVGLAPLLLGAALVAAVAWSWRRRLDAESEARLAAALEEAEAEAEVEANPWEFYLTTLDDAPASVVVDLSLRTAAPVSGADTLHELTLQMQAEGPHGLGDDAEAAALGPAEDAFLRGAEELRLLPAGRVRSGGTWRIGVYGPASGEAIDGLREIADRAAGASGRPYRLTSRPDPDWSWYREVLEPDAERLQWILDRRVVETLMKHGDPLEEPRRVEHWLYFPSAADRDACAARLAAEGFEIESSAPEEDDDESRWLTHAARVDAVDLDSIHDIVMQLRQLAEEHGGEYDGWETRVLA